MNPPGRLTNSLAKLLDAAGVECTCGRSLTDVRIAGISDDAREIGPGDVFVAIPGTHHDGHRFIRAAVDGGAVAVVLSDAGHADARVPCVLVQDTREALARLTAVRSGLSGLQRDGCLSVAGVTGTNGKSTTCHLVRNIMEAAGKTCAVLGTIGYDLPGRSQPAPWTTPPAKQLAELLVEAHRLGAGQAVMEVSSHALEQRRPDGVRFAVAVFTNLTGDHLDYHCDMAAYARSKKRLFDRLGSDSTAVINADDPRGEEMIEDCAARVVRFSLSRPVEVRASAITSDIHGSRFELNLAGRRLPISLPLVGRHNISNALAASAAAWALGIEPEAIQAALNKSRNVRGRLHRAEPPGHPFSVFVDYAHTDDALENVLTALRPLTAGRLWCVFGCGGDRDRSKRPRMAAVCARHADQIVVTSDNPRTEDPHRIIQDILTGFDGRLKQVEVEPDRRRAIQLALRGAAPQDAVLIAGKGHEDYQIVGDQRLHFDDLEVVQEELSAPQGLNLRPELSASR